MNLAIRNDEAKYVSLTLDNGGVRIIAEDGFLSRVSDAGRGITDLRERIKSGDIDLER